MRNKILRALPPGEFEALSPSLEPYPFMRGDVLYEVGESMEHVYFREGGIVSLVCEFGDGTSAEVATVGNEGMVGLPLYFDAPRAAFRTLVQVRNGGQRMRREDFARHHATLPTFDLAVRRYANVLLVQTGQNVACNARHGLAERCARWLLTTADRVGSAQFLLTHEFLAQMLGVHRPSMTLVARSLQNVGLIRYQRGDLTILDREGLEDAACECYGIITGAIEAE